MLVFNPLQPRRAVRLLLLPAGRPLQRVHLRARGFVSGNHLISPAPGASIIKRIKPAQREQNAATCLSQVVKSNRQTSRDLNFAELSF